MGTWEGGRFKLLRIPRNTCEFMSLQVAEGIAAPAKDAVCPGNLEGKDEQEDANAEHGDANARHEARVECPRQDLAAQPENSSAEHASGEINWESDSGSRPRNVSELHGRADGRTRP